MTYAIETRTVSVEDDYASFYKTIATFDNKEDAQRVVDALNKKYQYPQYDIDIYIVELPHNPSIDMLIEAIDDLI